MPRIERYTRGIIKPRAVADTVDAGAISAAQKPYEIAADISQVAAETTDRFVQAQEATAVNEAIIKNKKRKMEYLEQARQENMSNPSDFAKRIEPELKKIDDEMMQGLPTGRAKSVFQERMQQVNLSAYENNFKWERTRQVEMFAESVESSALELGNMAFIAAKQGASLDEIRKDAQATIIAGSTLVSPEKMSELQRETMKTVERNYAMGLMEREPQAAIDYLNDIEKSGSITAGDRVNLINTAQNVIEANEREDERAQARAQAEVFLQTSDIRERVYNQEGKPADLLQEIRRIEDSTDNATIKKSMRSLAKVVSADKRAAAPEKRTPEEKDDFLTELQSKLDDMYQYETISDEYLESYNEIMEFANTGVADGFITVAKKNSLIRPEQEQLGVFIEENNVNREWADLGSGIANPNRWVIPKINKEIKTPSSRNQVLLTFHDLIGRVDENGNILPQGKYKTTNNTTADEQVLDRALQKAIEIHNKNVSREAVQRKASGVVAAVPKVGDIVEGHRFKGGDPADPKNWESVE